MNHEKTYQTVIWDAQAEFERATDAGAALLRQGALVAFPTETVYGLGADACNERAVAAIYAAKGRPSDNPMIVHVASVEQAERLAVLTPLARALMAAFWPGPLTLILEDRGVVTPAVRGGVSSLGVRMPAHPVALALIQKSGVPVAGPSANRSGRPSPTQAAHVWEDLQGRIPMILDAGTVEGGVESTVLSLLQAQPTILRPGLVTPDMISNIVGEVALGPSLLEAWTGEGNAASPGVKYKHYAPRAQVLLVAGEGQGQRNALLAQYDQALQNGKRTLILATCENAPFYGDRNYAIMGRKEDAAALCHALFSLLRQADADGMEVVLIEAIPAKEGGLAFMNRALRAAAFQVIQPSPSPRSGE